jgi:hypothetical protein
MKSEVKTAYYVGVGCRAGYHMKLSQIMILNTRDLSDEDDAYLRCGNAGNDSMMICEMG